MQVLAERDGVFVNHRELFNLNTIHATPIDGQKTKPNNVQTGSEARSMTVGRFQLQDNRIFRQIFLRDSA
jgi:hypothetical protein